MIFITETIAGVWLNWPDFGEELQVVNYYLCKHQKIIFQRFCIACKIASSWALLIILKKIKRSPCCYSFAISLFVNFLFIICWVLLLILADFANCQKGTEHPTKQYCIWLLSTLSFCAKRKHCIAHWKGSAWYFFISVNDLLACSTVHLAIFLKGLSSEI